MSRPVSLRDTANALREAMNGRLPGYHAVAEDFSRRVRDILRALPPGSTRGELARAISIADTHTVTAIRDAAAQIDKVIRAEADRLDSLVPTTAPAASAAPVNAVGTASAHGPAGNPELPRELRYRVLYKYRDASAMPLEPTTLSVETARQGAVGNCYFIGSVNAVAGHAPEIFDGAVTERGNAVAVRLGDRVIEVERTLPMDPLGRLPFATTDDGSAFVPMLEKAFATVRGSYRQMDGGQAAPTLAWLTQRPVNEIWWNHPHAAPARITSGGTPEDGEAPTDEEILEICSAGRPAVLSTRAFATTGPQAQLAKGIRVTELHLYTVKGVDDLGLVHLHNPMNMYQPKPMPPAVVRELFADLSWTD